MARFLSDMSVIQQAFLEALAAAPKESLSERQLLREVIGPSPTDVVRHSSMDELNLLASEGFVKRIRLTRETQWQITNKGLSELASA
ncbi:hypothetical protein LCGC14_0864750 [marine sediment metagenome]|uniref:Uncharacterized protein n=1 Tax=marine sediment metagenome TaxID=412755 RepID=A0A0F9SDF8_9ZZZZ